MKSLKKEFLLNVIPSVFSFFLGAFYCFCDAFFVGNRVGDLGLAAINICFSFLSVFIAAGSGIGMGASVRYSLLMAENRQSNADDYLSVANILMLLCSAVVTIPCFLFSKKILILLGASENIANLGKNYFLICASGAFAQIFSCGLAPICRNLNGIMTSMFSFVIGCVVNIVLDWLFIWVFEWGLEGAAAATVIGQLVSLFICLVFLIRRKKFSFRYRGSEFKNIFSRICRIGLSPFGLTVVPNISVVILNKASLFYGGEEGLAAYGCMAYLVYIVYMVIQGVTDGAQPLISTYFGKKDFDSLKRIEEYTYSSSISVALISFVIEFIFRSKLGFFMGSSTDTALIIEKGIPVFALGFFFVAVSRSAASCLYACEKNRRSFIISYSEPLFIILSLIIIELCLPMGLSGVWISNTAGQFMVMATALICFLQSGF